MKLVDLRLAFRLHRFEIVGFGVLIVLLSIAAVVTAGMLDATGYGTQCRRDGGPNPAACEAMGRAFYGLQRTQVPMVESILVALPFLLGVLVGAPLVARELERGTSRLAWSLAPSRFAWFLSRLVPGTIVVVAFSLLAGLALDRLMASVEPGTDVGHAFVGFGSRGVVLAARATFVFAVGVSVGALSGRVLPALIITAVIGYVGLAGGSYVHGRILASEAVWVDTESGTGAPGDLFIDQRVRTRDGRVVTWDEFFSLVPPSDDGTGPPPGYTFVALVVPGERYPLVELRESGALAGGSLASLAIAGLAIRRRRPG